MRKKLSRHELGEDELRALRQNIILKEAVDALGDMNVDVSVFSIWKYLSRQVADPNVNLSFEDLRFVYPLLRLVRPKKVERKGWEQKIEGGLKRDKG